MRVIPVACRADNYMYIIEDPPTKSNAIVDPYDPKKLLKAASDNGITIDSNTLLLTTHHHNDHSGGNAEILSTFPTITAYGGSDKSPGTNKILSHLSKFKIGSLDVTAIATPCHTQDHICYYVEDAAGAGEKRAVFTGDTLFVSGCGRFFEGTAKQMDVALNERLGSLPDDTVTFVGHEYTKSNVAFSKNIDPTNPAILKLEKYAKDNEVTTGKSTLGDEKEWNVFMRLGSAAVRNKTGKDTPIEIMQELRELKNNFKDKFIPLACAFDIIRTR